MHRITNESYLFLNAIPRFFYFWGLVITFEGLNHWVADDIDALSKCDCSSSNYSDKQQKNCNIVKEQKTAVLLKQRKVKFLVCLTLYSKDIIKIQLNDF